MSADVNPYDDSQPITAIDFSILSAPELKSLSVVGNTLNGIDIYELYDGQEPKRGGLFDPHFGPLSNDQNCATCGLSINKCPGHFGHIELATPIFHIEYVRFLKQLLSCVCLRCSKVLLPVNGDAIRKSLETKINKRSQFETILNLAKNVKYCLKSNNGCGCPVYKIVLDIDKNLSSINLRAEINVKKLGVDENVIRQLGGKDIFTRQITPGMAYNILKNISYDDWILMGLDPNKSSYEDMILKLLPVPPVCMHPPAKLESISSTPLPDYLTRKLVDIIKANQKLRQHREQAIDNTIVESDEKTDLLQFHVITYMDSSAMSTKEEQSAQTHTAIVNRWTGKVGRIRGNLMGKRVNFTARTVITGDPNLRLNEVGIPLSVAKHLTVPVTVAEHNIQELTQLVHNGPDIYPGANDIIPFTKSKSEGRRYIKDLHYGRENVELKIGDIVNRHLQNGDIVLMNRQPSLHRLSMMGHRVVILPEELAHVGQPYFSTFRINASVCPPYNADFDGDEMNLHVPQNEQATLELTFIGDVRLNIISPGKGIPLVGCVFDTLNGARLMTLDDSLIDWKEASNILSYADLSPIYHSLKINKKQKTYSGHEIFSKLIPKGINVTNKEKDEITFQITNGILKKGTIDKSQIGQGKNTIVHQISQKYGTTEAINFIYNVQRVMLQYLYFRGFTVGIRDFMINEELQKKINIIISTKKLEVEHKITEMENNYDLLESEIFEASIKAEIDVIMPNIAELIMNNMDNKNNFYQMVKSGSKGGKVSIGLISGCFGQQTVLGRRIEKKVHGRTTVHFHQNDDGMKARGFIENSYLNGLDPVEYFFVSFGREGNIDTSIRTADVGYVQRRLIKILEDVCSKYDGTVRTAADILIQVVYGDSGINTIKQYNQKLNIMKMGDDKIREKYVFNSQELKEFSDYGQEENEKFYSRLIKLRDKLRIAVSKLILEYFSVKDDFYFPVNLTWIIDDFKNTKTKTQEPLSPNHILNRIKRLLTHKISFIMGMSKKDTENKSLKNMDEKLAKYAFKAFLYEMLSPKRCILDYKLNKEQFDLLMEELAKKFKLAVLPPGESVGVICGESIGEPATQMNLNTFHFAGVGEKSASQIGLPRLKELLSVSKNPKSLRMRVYLLPEYSGDKRLIHQIASQLRYTVLSEVSQKIDIYYDPPNLQDQESLMEQDGIENIYISMDPTSKTCQQDITSLPWLLRIELSKEKMYEHNVTLLDIKSKLCYYWARKFLDLRNLKKRQRKLLSKIIQFAVLSNYDNSPTPILHLRFDMTEYDYSTLVEFQKLILSQIKLKGLEGVTQITGIDKQDCYYFDPNTQEMKTRKEYIIITKGVNMKDIRYIKGIDLNRTSCDSIWHMYETFGIESAKNILLKEFEGNMSGGGNVLPQHFILLTDVMTNIGEPVSVDRNGIRRMETDPLSRASFEKIIDQLFNAAIFGERDYMRSVTARIMTGQVIRAGTCNNDLLLDHKKIENSEYVEELETIELNKTFRELGINTIVEDKIKRKKVQKQSFYPRKKE